MVYSINQQKVAEEGGMSASLANYWRTGPDISPVYEAILDRALRNNNVSVTYLPGSPGGFNDPDMVSALTCCWWLPTV